MYAHISVVVAALILPHASRLDDAEAARIAREALTKGAALFDARDATIMASTFTDDAQIHWFDKEESTGKLKRTIKDGRGEIEALYQDFFKDAKEKTTSRNNIESARLIAPDVVIIQGTFEPDVSKPGKFPFVQTRVKQGEKWLVKSLDFYVISQD